MSSPWKPGSTAPSLVARRSRIAVAVSPFRRQRFAHGWVPAFAGMTCRGDNDRRRLRTRRRLVAGRTTAAFDGAWGQRCLAAGTCDHRRRPAAGYFVELPLDLFDGIGSSRTARLASSSSIPQSHELLKPRPPALHEEPQPAANDVSLILIGSVGDKRSRELLKCGRQENVHGLNPRTGRLLRSCLRRRAASKGPCSAGHFLMCLGERRSHSALAS